MARRTYLDIDAELLLRMANRSDVTSTMRGHFIKDAYLSVAMLFKHKELQLIANESVSQGFDSWTPLATDVWFPTLMRNVTDGYIIRLDSQVRVERAQTKPTSRPYTYYWYGGVFTHEAFADTTKVIKLWYKRKPIDFSGTQSSELDEMFDQFIIMDAARIGFETVRDFDEAAKQLGMFKAEAQAKDVPLEMAKLNDYRQGFRVRFK
jgi:hypothetical protein